MNPCPLRGSVESQPLGPQGSPLGLCIYLGSILCMVWGELQVHFPSVIAKAVCPSTLWGPASVLVKCSSTRGLYLGSLRCAVCSPVLASRWLEQAPHSSSSRASGLVQALCNPMDLLGSACQPPQSHSNKPCWSFVWNLAEPKRSGEKRHRCCVVSQHVDMAVRLVSLASCRMTFSLLSRSLV